MPTILVPDASVLVDGRLTALVLENKGCRVHVPSSVLAALEAQATEGLETGFAALHELSEVQALAREDACTVTIHEDASPARDVARDVEGTFVTSDRVQAYAAEAEALEHHYLRPEVDGGIDGLSIWKYFDDDVTSVHLKADCVPKVKRGKPGEVVYEDAGTTAIGHADVRSMAQECIEACRREYRAFVELERKGCSVLQVGNLRITIAQPPFSDALEITAVRPIHRATMREYELPDEILERIEGNARGVFIAGPPGSGKSTFAAAAAEHLHAMGRVVKTMEQPRDLQVPEEVTQYAALDRDMTWTGEVMLLVRPDHVVYDEVRTTGDFNVFADMRLAGIGLLGVTHANRPIDAVQRLIGRVDLGMVPQIVDTVLFIDAARVAAVLELQFTVRVPAGMNSEDLARPVVIVRDALTGEERFELYSFGEQIVVMPLDQVGRASSGQSALAAEGVRRQLRAFVRGPMEVVMNGGTAIVTVEEAEVPLLIGKGGRTVQGLEQRLGIRLDIRGGHPEERPAAPPGRGKGRPSKQQGVPVRRTGSNVFLLVEAALGGRPVRAKAEGAVIGEGVPSSQGKLRFKANSPEGKAAWEAHRRGIRIDVTPL